MPLLKRRVIDNEIEHQLLTGIITSDSFAQRIIPMLNSNYFTADHTAIVFDWVKAFFTSYKKCPQGHIQDIYNTHRDSLEEDKQKLIENFLSSISEKFEKDSDFNVDYLIDKAVNWTRTRAAFTSASSALKFLESGRIDKAEQEFQNYKKAVKATTEWVNPLDPAFIRDTLQTEENETNHIFKFPGALGELSGWHERSWLIAVLAPMKRGKTFFLMEVAMRCILNSKKVAFFSLEMSEKRMEGRLLKRIAGYGKVDKEYMYPCFDCAYNQDNSCKRANRTNKVALFIKDKEKPRYDKNMEYKVCVSCRINADDSNTERQKKKGAYLPATWFKTIRRPLPTTSKIVSKAKGIMKMYGDNFRMKSYPANSANTSSIKADLDTLEYTEGFIPDVIIIDYADILKTEDSRITDVRARSDETWKMLKNLADSRHCLVVTASQGTRKSIDKTNIGQVDIAEDIRKLAHVDMMYALNQTPKEKKESIMRISVIGHRDEDFNEKTNAIVLQQREVGQVLLDSEMARYESAESFNEDEE